MFDGNKRIVGTLTGGTSECGSDDQPDWYGALTQSWNYYTNPSWVHLSDWLDPIESGATWLDGTNANPPPRSLGAIDDRAVKVPGDGESPVPLSVDVARFFFDDGPLAYAATSSDEAKVTVSVSGSSVTVTPVAAGASTITVTATEADGFSSRTVTQTFQVTAGANRSPETVGKLADQFVNRLETVEIDLASGFRDADGDALTYVASSSDTSVATVSVSVSTVTVTGVDGRASATIEVTATDAGGSNTRARQFFDVTVRNGPPQAVGSFSEVLLQVGSGNKVVDLDSLFTDPEGDALNYSLQSRIGYFSVVKASRSGSNLTLSPVARER